MGRHLRAALELRRHEVFAFVHEELDICDKEKSLWALEQIRPDAVVNAAAYCSFDGCERDEEHSRRVNLEAPLWWSEECAKRGIRLVLFSSDYIFDGTQRQPYTEEDPPNPLNVYGRHKAELESRARQVETNLIFRPSWIFGLDGKTFMSMLPRLFCELIHLEVASGKIGTCLHAADGAKAVVELLEQGKNGVWNLVHPGETSWEEFAEECLHEMRNRGLPVICRGIEKIPFEELFTTTGKRPVYSALDISKTQSALQHPLPDWRTGLRNYLTVWQKLTPSYQNHKSLA